MKLLFLIAALLIADRGLAIESGCAQLMMDRNSSMRLTLPVVDPQVFIVGRSFSVRTSEAGWASRKLFATYENYLRLRPDVNGDFQSLVSRFDTVILETVENAAKYGNRRDPSKRIYFKISLQKEFVQVEIADESGRFFDPNDPNETANKMRFVTDEDSLFKIDEIEELRRQSNHDPERPGGEGGRGILLIQAFSDTATYVPNTNADGKIIGTKVILKWNFPRPKKQPNN